MKRKFRITRSIDYKRVRRSGKSYAHPLVVLVKLSNTIDCSRAGIITGKSVGNAVIRNRVKRQLRTILAEFIQGLKTPSDIVLIAREPIRDAQYFEIKSAVSQLLKKADLIDLDDSDAGRPTS